MTHELVESFLEVVRLQSVSAAAQALYVSQSTVSHRLQVLESELGVKLFFRQRGFKQIALTESGKPGSSIFPLSRNLFKDLFWLYRRCLRLSTCTLQY